MSLLSTLNWITNGILLDNSTDSSFFLLTPLDHTPYVDWHHVRSKWLVET